VHVKAPIRISEADQLLLAFLAEHRVALANQVQALLGGSVEAVGRRLGRLERRGFIRRWAIPGGHAACCQIRARGLAAIGSDLPSPRLKLASYEHDVGVAWLWIAATRGAFGPLRETLGERRLRSHDGKMASEVAGGLGQAPLRLGPSVGLAEHLGRGIEGVYAPYGVRLGGAGPHGRGRLHYPDLLLISRDGRRIALELELSAKTRTRREHILLGYATDRRIHSVLYLVEDHGPGLAIGRAVQASARMLGLGPLLTVRRVRLPDGKPLARNPGEWASSPDRSSGHRASSRDWARGRGRTPRLEAAR